MTDIKVTRYEISIANGLSIEGEQRSYVKIESDLLYIRAYLDISLGN